MALEENLINQHIQKIFFMKMNYLDVTGTLQTKFYSDCFCEIPKNLVSGATIVPEQRLENVPFFLREIKLMTSEVVVKSEYTLSIINSDEALTNFIVNNYFTGQNVELYVTTEDNLAPFSCQKIFVGTIKDVDVGDKIDLKISEVSDLTKMQTYEFQKYNYTYQDSSLQNSNKPVLFGKHVGLEPKSISNFSAVEDFNMEMEVTLRVFQSLQGNDLQTEKQFYANNRGKYVYTRKYILGIKYDTDVQFFPGAQYVRPTDIYAIMTVSTLADQLKVNQYLDESTVIILNNTEYEYVATKLENSRVYILKQKGGEDLHTEPQQGTYTLYFRKPSQIQNTKFLISTNKTDTKIKSDIVSITNTTSPSLGVTIVLTDNWNFLESGDLIYLTSSSLESYREEFRVNNYDPSTKTIQIALDAHSARFSTATLKCNFDYVQKIKIGERVFKRQRSLITLDPYAGSSLTFSSTNAIANVPFFRFTHNTTGIAGNLQGFEMIHDAAIVAPYTPLITNIPNFVRVRISEGNTTAAQVKTALDAAGVPFTVVLTGTGAELPTVTTEIMYFTTGRRNSPFLYLAVHTQGTDSIIDDNFFNGAEMYAIAFAPTSFPTTYDTRLKNVQSIDTIIVTGSETKSQMADKIVTAINTGIYSNFLTAVKVPLFNYVKIKWHFLGNTSNRGMTSYNCADNAFDSNGAINDTYTQITFRPFVTRIENTSDLILELDREGLALSSNNTSSKSPEFYCKYTGNDNAVTPYRTESSILVPVDPKNTETMTISTGYWGATGLTSINTIDLVTNKTIVQTGDILSLNRAMLYDDVNKTDYFFPKNYNTHVFKVDDQNGNAMYTSAPAIANIPSSEISNRLTFNVYRPIEIKDLVVDYKDEYSHFGNYLKEMLDNFYQITEYSTISVDAILSIPFLTQYSIFNDNTEFYKSLNASLKSFNMNIFINKDGKLDIKFYNTISFTSDFNINYYDIFARDFKSSEIDYSDLKYCYLYNQKVKNYKEEFLADIAFGKVATTFKNILKIESNAMFDSSNNARYNSYTFAEYIAKKYDKKDSYVTITLGHNYINQIDLFKNFKIIGDPLNLDSVIYKISKVEFNFDKIKITAKRLN